MWIALVALAILLAAGGAIAWIYRTRLNQAALEIQLVARSEARAVASNDRESFLALQDREDYAWRAVQEKRFGQLSVTNNQSNGRCSSRWAQTMARCAPGG